MADETIGQVAAQAADSVGTAAAAAAVQVTAAAGNAVDAVATSAADSLRAAVHAETQGFLYMLEAKLHRLHAGAAAFDAQALHSLKQGLAGIRANIARLL